MNDTETQLKERTEEDEVFAALVEGFDAMFAKFSPGEDDDEAFCVKYLKTGVECDALQKKIDEMYGKMCRGISAERKTLQSRKGVEFRGRVQNLIDKQKGTKKSINLMTGTAGFKKGKDSLVFADVETAKEWMLKDSGWTFDQMFAAISGIVKTECVVRVVWVHAQTKSTMEAIAGLNKTPFKEHLEATGELPPGCELHEAEDSFFPWIRGEPALPMGQPKAEYWMDRTLE